MSFGGERKDDEEMIKKPNIGSLVIPEFATEAYVKKGEQYSIFQFTKVRDSLYEQIPSPMGASISYSDQNLSKNKPYHFFD